MGEKVKTNKTTSYALMAIGYIAQHYQEGYVTVSAISERYNIPLLYLFKVILKLSNANIVRSKRGPNGGMTLTRPPKDITMLEIIEAVDGPMVNNLQLAEHTNNEPFSLKMEEVCHSATEKASKLLSKAKLSEMVKK